MKKPKKRTWVVLGCVFLVILFVFNFIIRFVFGMPMWLEREETIEVIPKMEISLNGTTLEEIHNEGKDVKYGGNDLTLVIDGEDLQFSDVEIRGRGNSTWGQPKRPYQIKFAEKVGLFGMGKARKWVLLANYFDVSQIRTDVAFYLERMLEMEYALNGSFVNLVIDGEDLGLYYLTPKVEIGKNRVDLREPDGILVEFDNLYGKYEEYYRSREGHFLVVKDAVVEDNEEWAMQNFLADFDKLILAAEKGDFDEVMKVADAGSLAKYYLLSEFTVNPDGYVSSLYFYKDGAEDKIHAGPGWDFDFAMGNRKWIWAVTEDFYSPFETRVQEQYAFGGKIYDSVSGEYIDKKPDQSVLRLFYYLMKISEFRELVNKIYQEKMMGEKEKFFNHIDEQVKLIKESAIWDAKKWEQEDFESAVATLKKWLTDRYEYFDEIYGGFWRIAEPQTKI